MRKTTRNKRKYKFLWNNFQPHYTIEANLLSLEYFRSILWNQLNNIIQVSKNNMIYCFHSVKDLKNDREKGRYFFEKDYVKNYFKEINKNYAIQWRMFKYLDRADFRNHSNKQLFDIYKRSVFHWGKMISYFRSTQAEGTYFLVEKLRKVFTDEEITVLMTPTVLDLANKEILDWQKIVNKPYSKRKLLNHTKRYPWIVMSHFVLNAAIETLTQRYHFDKKQSQHYDFDSEKRKIRRKQESLLKNHKNEREIAHLLQKLAVYRMKIKSCWAGLDFYRIKLVSEITKRSGEFAVGISKYYLIKDVEDLLNGKPLSLSEKQRRKECFVGLWGHRKAMYLSGKEAEELAKSELKELYTVKKTNILKGMVANPGKVQGIARILLTNDIEKTRELRKNFKKGEILFTGMTQPNIVDIASRAGAIVTDEGGMLSHAAIISREFKIPCIVGTHSGTQVFKDRDLVEVDADKGIVKKIG